MPSLFGSIGNIGKNLLGIETEEEKRRRIRQDALLKEAARQRKEGATAATKKALAQKLQLETRTPAPRQLPPIGLKLGAAIQRQIPRPIQRGFRGAAEEFATKSYQTAETFQRRPKTPINLLKTLGGQMLNVGSLTSEVIRKGTEEQLKTTRLKGVKTKVKILGREIELTAPAAIGFGLSLADPLGLGAKGSSLTKIAKLKNADDIVRELSKLKGLKLPAEELPTLAKKLVKPSTVEEVSSVLKGHLEQGKAITYSLGSKKTATAFNKSTDQIPITKIGKAKVELGSFGRNAGERKVVQIDRFPKEELAETLKKATRLFRASDDPTSYRSDNIAWISKVGKETRVIYTRLNAKGNEEIINWHKISDPKYLKGLEKYGAPSQIRTGKMNLEGSQFIPLAYRGIDNVPQAINKSNIGPSLSLAPEPPNQVITAFEQVKESIKKLYDFNPTQLEEAAANSKKTNQMVANMFRKGVLTVDQIPEFKKWGYGEEDAARFVEQFATFGGKDLNRISQWQKALDDVLPEEIIDTIKPQGAAITDFILNKLPTNVINLWRASLVSQMATAARNLAVSGGVLYPARIFEDVLVGVTQAITKKMPPKEAFTPAIEDLFAILNRVRPTKRAALATLLEQNPLIKNKLYATPVMDVAVTNKIAKVVTVFNNTQEYFMRNFFFESILRGKLGQAGQKLENLRPDQVPANLMSDAAEEALRLTFAQNPTNKFGRELVRLSNQMPFALLNAVVYPFPRFLTNAVKTIVDYSPGGLLRFVSPKNAKLLAKGDEQSLRYVARAAVGVNMFLIANYIRNSDHAGEKWYEMKVAGKTVDVRPFGPLLPTYMFLSEAIKGDLKFGPKDWVEGMLGVNRIAGTTLFLTSMLSGQESFEGFQKEIQKFAGTFLAGFATPAITVKDLLGNFMKEERIARYTKENPLLGPTLERIPFARRLLPEAPSVTRAEPFEREAPGFRQLTGITLSTKTPIEQELDKLQMSFFDFVPKTGDKFIDRLLTTQMGSFIEQKASRIKDPDYQALDDFDKEESLRDLFKQARAAAKEQVLSENKNEIAARFYEVLLDKKDNEERNETWNKWEHKLGKNFMGELYPIIAELKQKGYSPQQAYSRLQEFGREIPLEIGGLRLP